MSADGPHLTAVQRDQRWIPAAAAEARASRLELQVLHLHELLLSRQVDIGDPFTAVVMAVRFARRQRLTAGDFRPRNGAARDQKPAVSQKRLAAAEEVLRRQILRTCHPFRIDRIHAGMRGTGGRTLPVAEDQQLALLGSGQQRCMDSDNVSVGSGDRPGHCDLKIAVPRNFGTSTGGGRPILLSRDERFVTSFPENAVELSLRCDEAHHRHCGGCRAPRPVPVRS